MEEEKRVESYLSWLDSEIKIYEAYHDSKETKAWTAVAAYTAATLALGHVATSACPGYANRIILTILLAVAMRSMLGFVRFQFEKRWEADCIVRGLRRARGKLIQGPPVPAQERLEDADEKFWPKFIAEEIDRCKKDTKREWREWKDVQDWSKWKTEIPSYGVMAIGTMIAIGSLWIKG